jgi:hypothetical protein
VRVGAGPTFDGMGMSGSDYCIIDHCSISWSIDEAFSSRSGLNITLQRTLISEALNVANHQNYPSGTKHGYAASISGDVGSFHHNLLAHCYGRNWSLAGGLDGNGDYAGRLDISNNVVYNFGSRTTDGGAHEVNFVSNYYKPGPGHTGNNYALNAQNDGFPGMQRYYFKENVMPGHFDESNQEKGRRESGKSKNYSTWVDQPFFPSEITLQSAGDAYKTVLSDVGCVQPMFDAHDKRIIQETLKGTYTYKGSKSGIKGMPDSHLDVGGYEDYPELQHAADWDSDNDGLPNWWETILGTNVNSAANEFSDANGDVDSDGFTNLEEYLEWVGAPHYMMGSKSDSIIDLKAYTKGYEKSPVYTIKSVIYGTAEVLNTGSEMKFTGKSVGLGEVIFEVKDADGSSMQRKINFLVGVNLPQIEEYVFVEEEVVEEEVVEEEVIEQEETTLGLLAIDTIIFPNPVKSEMTIKNASETSGYTILDMSGSEVLSKKGFSTVNSLTIPVSTLKSGIYFLKLETKKSTTVYKFSKVD